MIILINVEKYKKQNCIKQFLNFLMEKLNMKKLILFKSPTCGPCKLFAPVVKSAAEKLEAEYIEIDVSSDDGFEIAKKYGIRNSGSAVYEIDDEVKFKWTQPVPLDKLLTDIK